jgi:hypothetical protein
MQHLSSIEIHCDGEANVASVLKKLDRENLSMQPGDGTAKQSPMFVGGQAQDDVSAPTVSGSFSDEDFSLSSDADFLGTQELHATSHDHEYDNNDNLSLSSINTKALITITELSKRLRIQENTKLELLNQCLRLEGKLEKNDCKHAFLRIYKAENNQLREGSAKMERDFMNEIVRITTTMSEMENEYQDKLQQRDEKIALLEEELKLLKVSKNLDDVLTIDTVLLKQSNSGSSSVTK